MGAEEVVDEVSWHPADVDRPDRPAAGRRRMSRRRHGQQRADARPDGAARERHCARVFHVQTDADLRAEWFEAAELVGLTAGTSTPDDVIDRVEAGIRRFAGVAERAS